MQPGMRGYVYGTPIDWGSPITVAPTQYQGNSGARCTRLNGEDWVFWKDAGSNRIFYKFGKDQAWPPYTYTFRFSSDEVPGVATYRNQIHAVYKDPGSGAIYWSVYDGNWSDKIQISSAFTNASPALAVYKDQLVLAWSTKDSAPTLSFCWFEGTKWSALLSTRYSVSGSPAIAAHGGELFFACAQGINAPITYLRYANGILSAPQTTKDSYISEYGPALASNGAELRMTWNGYLNTQALTSTWARNSGWSAAGYFNRACALYSPGMYGDFSGFRVVWITSYPGGIMTISHSIDGGKDYWVTGAAIPGTYVTVSASESLTTRYYPPVRADSNGAWSMGFYANLKNGDRVEATASFEEYGPQSDAFVWVIGQSQDGNNLLIRDVTSEGVSGYAPLPGQVIKGWRSSDGKLVVNYPVAGTSFEAPYLFPGAYIEGDTINLVSQFPDDGSMTRFNGGPGRYSYP
ncbi:hypothetical protein [Martelella sp. FOR1707]